MSEQTDSEQVNLMPPGSRAVPMLAVSSGAHSLGVRETLSQTNAANAQWSRDSARREVEKARTSNSLAALAQTSASSGETIQAIAAAREALELSIGSRDDRRELVDPASARIAVEVLSRLDHMREAFTVLRDLKLGPAMSVTLAELATALGEPDAADQAIATHTGQLVDSFRGYLYAARGQWQQAIHYLRNAVNAEPEDVDALLNLSISLWNLGSARKATRTALIATRTAPGRKDVSLLYLELLLAQNQTEQLATEIRRLRQAGVAAEAAFLAIEARARFREGKTAPAITL